MAKFTVAVRWCFSVSLVLAAGSADAAFLEGQSSARGLALGGNTVALDGVAPGLDQSPASLDGLRSTELDLRYQSEGLAESFGEAGSSLAGFAMPSPAWPGALGLAWERYAVSVYAEDRLRVPMTWDFAGHLTLGVDLDWLSRSYQLDQAITQGLNLRNSAQALDLEAGLLWHANSWLSAGVQGANLLQPDLGVFVVQREMPIWRWGLAFQAPSGPARNATLLLGQTWDAGAQELSAQAGLEYRLPFGFCVRAGAQPRQGGVGLGMERGAWRADYAYSFAAFGSSLGGADQSLEMNWKFGSPWAHKIEERPSPKAAPIVSARVILLTPTPSPPIPTVPRPAPIATAVPVQQTIQPLKARAQALLGAAVAEEGLSRSARALADVAAAAALDPECPACVSERARLLDLMERPAPQPKPDEGELRLLEQAEAFRQNGRLDLAEKAAREAEKRRPDDPWAKELFASLSRERRVSKGARAGSKRLFDAGAQAFLSGNTETARTDWERALKADPGNADAFNSLMRWRMDEGGAKKP